MTLDQIFGPTGLITWEQECARAVLIFVYGTVAVRLAGRRLFAQRRAVDIIVAIVLGSTLSRALTGNADLFGTLAATTLLIALHWLTSLVLARSPALAKLLDVGPG